jgi:hypothetical protein
MYDPVDLTPGDRNGAFQLLECLLGQISSLYLKRKENQCNFFKNNVFDIVSCVLAVLTKSFII